MQTERSEMVHGVFETISLTYDDANNRISLGFQKSWKKKLVGKILSVTQKKGSVLDVCCGTGDIAISIASLAPEICATGLDFSAAMLLVAKERAKDIKNITWLEGDAMALPFPDGSFDAVSISFGLRNTPDFSRVVSEMARVTSPGGYIFCLDSFVPDSRLIRPFYSLYFKVIMPILGGGRKFRKEYKWLSRSTEEFLRKDELTALFKKNGLAEVSARSFMFGACNLHMGRKP